MIIKGIDRVKEYEETFKNKRLGLITSVTGITSDLRSSIDVLNENYNLVALFAPEHGVRGDIEAGKIIENSLDPITGIPVYSLYRKDGKNLTQEMLDAVDVIVFDIGDVGARYYTYISTMIGAIKACAVYKKTFVVLDRPNPLGGEKVEGPLLEMDYSSFVGAYPLPVRYGLTAGELALMVNREEGLNCELTVIPCKEWDRKWLAGYREPYFMTSPNIPTLDTALAYIGTCLFEGTNISEGRGTASPFKMIGAPFINAKELAYLMNKKELSGVYFLPAYFKPTTSKFTGEFCQGVQLVIHDLEAYEGFKTGLYLLETIKDLYPLEYQVLPAFKEGGRPFISLLMGSNVLEDKQWKAEEIIKQGNKDSRLFIKRKEQYHLY